MALKNLDKIPEKYHQDLEDFSELCVNKFGKNLISIVLFGSIARKKNKKWSDFDFYVITKNGGEKKRLEVMYRFPQNCDILLRKEQDIPAYLKNLSAVDLDVFNDGVLIYGKDIIKKNKKVFEGTKRRYGLTHHAKFGKGVWEIGTAG